MTLPNSDDFKDLNSSELTFALVTDRNDPPILTRQLKPHRSLSNNGFVWVIAILTLGLSIPLLAFVGTTVLWVLLPFLGGAVVLLWAFIRRNDFDGTLFENIRVWHDLIAVHRHNPRGDDQFWTAHPYWIRAKIQDTKRIESYLTLKEKGREIELGAFLTPEGRQTLHADLEQVFARAKAPEIYDDDPRN